MHVEFKDRAYGGLTGFVRATRDLCVPHRMVRASQDGAVVTGFVRAFRMLRLACAQRGAARLYQGKPGAVEGIAGSVGVGEGLWSPNTRGWPKVPRKGITRRVLPVAPNLLATDHRRSPDLIEVQS